jgi:hypothetical protein
MFAVAPVRTDTFLKLLGTELSKSNRNPRRKNKSSLSRKMNLSSQSKKRTQVMNRKDQLKDTLISTMRALAPEDEWPLKFAMIERLIDTVVSDWSGEIEKEIVVLIAEWEAKIEDDDTLYTLGARRALDILRGEERTLNS